MSKIIQQRKKCIGCGACVSVCPDFLEMDRGDGLANLKNAKKAGEDFELEIEKIGCLKEAIDICPIQIIKIKK